MITKDTYDNFGKENEVITIDLSDKKHHNRVLDILEDVHQLTNEYQYTIKAQWTDAKFHPTLFMGEKDIIDLTEALKEWVTKIKARREGTK